MEKDLEILKKILIGQHIADNMVEVLMNFIVKKLEESGKSHITPQFLYVNLAFELGRKNATEIADEFENYLKTGEYKSKFQRFLDSSPWMKNKS